MGYMWTLDEERARGILPSRDRLKRANIATEAKHSRDPYSVGIYTLRLEYEDSRTS
jgi:hypothetical protein